MVQYQSFQGFMLLKFWTMFFLVTIPYGAQNKGAWSLSTNCSITARFTGHSKTVVTQHGTCLMSPSCHHEIGHNTMAPTILENLYTAGTVSGYNTMKTEAEVFYHMLVTTYLRLHGVITKTTSDHTLPDTPL